MISKLSVFDTDGHDGFGIAITRLVFITFCVEIILFGSGGWLQILSLPFRKIAFVAIVVLLLCYLCFSDFDVISKRLGMWLGFFVFFIIWGVIIPLFEQRSLALSFADFSPLLGLGIIPPLAALYRKGSYWARDKIFLVAALNFLAIFHVLAWIYGSISTENGAVLVDTMRDFLEPGTSIEDSSIFIGYTADGEFRVHWGPSVFLVLGLYFSFDRLRRHGITALTVLLILLQVAAIAATQSRGFWTALAAGSIVYYIGIRFFPNKDVRSAILMCVILLFGLTFLLIPFYSPDFLALIGLSRDGSDDIRSEQAWLILDQMWKTPLFGVGFGGGIDLIRSDAAPYAYEVSILALYMKLGLLGTIWAFALAMMLVSFLLPDTEIRKSNFFSYSLIYATVFCFVFATNSNPYLSNFFGLVLLTIMMIEFRVVSTYLSRHD